MMKKFAAVTLFMLSVSTSAMSSVYGTHDEVYCYDFKDISECSSHPECYWDKHEGYCESKDAEDYCKYIPWEGCNYAPMCIWNAKENRCDMRK
ncbi:MAG: hypothetical protein HQK54_07005 [Oligoflexales bacterium]|nr:hypothetical protein [Oligoflexales bacterium]